MTALHAVAANWVPANGGTETESRSRNGRRILYCWQRSTGKHAYIDLDADVELPREYDPALDGTEHDPLLPPKPLYLRLIFTLDPAVPLTAVLIEEQRDGSCLVWSVDVHRQATGFIIPRSLRSGAPQHHPREVTSRFGPEGRVAVSDPAQALAVVHTLLRACNRETVTCKLPAALRDLAVHACHKLNGDPSHIWADVQLLRRPAPDNTAFNW